MAVSDVDKQLIDKQISGSLTAKEHAVWSKRMQDQDFLQAWHQAQDMQMRSNLSDSKPRTSSEQKGIEGQINRPSKSVVRLVVICIVIILIFIFLIWKSV